MAPVRGTNSKMSPPFLTIVLAAGMGTRMKSAQPKVLHEIAGRSMLGHVLARAQSLGEGPAAVVVGPDMERVAADAKLWRPDAEIFVQHTQQGTADAVLAAKPALESHRGDVLVLYGDTPLITTRTLEDMRAALDEGAGVVVLGFTPDDPSGYGRLLVDDAGNLTAIREHKDASEAERAVGLCNSGVMAFRIDDLAGTLSKIDNNNKNSEYYLTDMVAHAVAAGGRVSVVIGSEDEVLGVNSRDQLAEAEAIWQRRRRLEVMQAGVTMTAPETVWLSYDTKLGQDVVIEPNVFFGPDVEIGDGVRIRANCHFTGARVGVGATIGPFARLRPGADLAKNVHVGNFVEIKNVALGAGAKANHLSYLGDGTVGAGANIGAGTIFCNYDGFFKHQTEIGAGSFVGSNSALVAPVKIGAGAYVGSGSVITKNVADNALALERSSQEERPGWAEKFRKLMSDRKRRASKS